MPHFTPPDHPAPLSGRAANRFESLLARLGRLSARRLALLAACVAMLLTLPALWSGFAQDDYFFLTIFKGDAALEALDLSPLESFSFFKGDPDAREAMMNRGYLPWWTAEGWKVNFCRPLSSLSHWVDYLAFGPNAFAMHLHSLLLYGLLVAIVALLYRRFTCAPAAAGLAALFFAADSGHAIPAAWLAMRNALLAVLFGLLVLWLHDAWRRAGRWWPRGPMAIACLVLSLLSAEAGIATGAYLFAYALFLDPAVDRDTPRIRAWTRSIAALLPYLAVVVVWRLAYSALGYGTEGSGLYLDPVGDAPDFLRHLPERMLILLMGLLAAPDATLWSLAPAAAGHILLGCAALMFVLFLWLAAPALRSRPEARFLLLGAVLSIVPACATLPMDRNLMFASFGGLGIVALAIADGLARPGARCVLAMLLVLAHGVLAPIGLLAGTQQLAVMNRILTGSNPSIPGDLKPGTRLVAMNTPTDLLGTSLPVYRAYHGQPIPDHWWWLYAGVADVAVTRSGAQSLTLRPDGPFVPATWALVFRHPESQPFRAGDTVNLQGLTVTVLEAGEDGRPREVRFDFDAPLEDASLHFLYWDRGAYHAFTPPPLGERTTVAGPRLRNLVQVGLGWTPR
ncbi:MAG: hypothetical protein KF886_10740 [Candidatus Hydrogenedentes bacterium]|nr:hypothetical protein [Candidatus Hydrogenedentota bacterium]